MRFSTVARVSSAALALGLSGVARAEPAEDPAIAQIIDEGMNRSEVMSRASDLFDGIGPRLTNSENLRKAQKWAIEVLKGYGLTNVHEEPFTFGLGWNLDSYSATMVAPRKAPLTVIPMAWSPPTDGTIEAPVILAPMSKEEHLAQWKGKLAGKIVMISLPGTTSESKEGVFQRYSDKDIADQDHFDAPNYDPLTRPRWKKAFTFLPRVAAFAKAEGALAIVYRANRDGKLVSGEGYFYQPGHTLALPMLQMAQEDYGRLARLATTGATPRISLSVAARYDDHTLQSTNIIAEIPGTDPKAGVVMAGAHFDSWIAGDGASDNGAGSVALIEAARLIHKLGIKPKRTIRFALWTGEEQGELGSLAYVNAHFGARPGADKAFDFAGEDAWNKAFPITVKPEHAALKAYFNVDNGSGKIRGIFTEGNVGVNPLLSEWLAPFKAMGAGALVASKTHGTDHEKFQAVGLNGYQFVQDPLDYETRVHHSTLDTLDHMRAADMRQISVVWAGVLWQAANSARELPRQPVPSQPTPTDPFKVVDPDE